MRARHGGAARSMACIAWRSGANARRRSRKEPQVGRSRRTFARGASTLLVRVAVAAACGAVLRLDAWIRRLVGDGLGAQALSRRHGMSVVLRNYLDLNHTWVLSGVASAFAIVNSVRIVAYVPQICAPAKD